jgi:hypothetical protein
MRLSIAVTSLLICGCAANPTTLCGSLVPPGWQRAAAPPGATAALMSAINSGRLAPKTNVLWYHLEDRVIACTLDRGTKDNCSVATAEFARSPAGWVKVSEDAVLCKVATVGGGA